MIIHTIYVCSSGICRDVVCTTANARLYASESMAAEAPSFACRARSPYRHTI